MDTMETAARNIEIMDTTLRDGEQTSGVSFMPHEKLMIARALLEKVGVDRIEVASARVSEGEKQAVANICKWAVRAGRIDRVEVLGFCDGTTSVDWLCDTGCRHLNLLCKGSRKHCEGQLRKTVDRHIDDIRAVVAYATRKGVGVNVYLEDWSNGIKDAPDYVFALMDGLQETPIERFMLPDTLGVLNPMQVGMYISQMVARYPDKHFDFHAHNDYDLAVANAYAAVNAGCRGVHTAVNGLGERAGNASLASVQAVLVDQAALETNVCEAQLGEISRLVETCSGIVVPPNKPIVGENVFTQVAGVHADGDSKAGLYMNDLQPERFGRRREYALGKTSGKANILKNLEELGLELSNEETRRVTERIIELGDKKEIVTRDDLPFIVSDVVRHSAANEDVRLLSYVVTTAYGLKPMASLRLEIHGKTYEEQAHGDGQFDAFVRAIRHIYRDSLGRHFPWLRNYTVGIPPGGRTDALVQTVITWEWQGKELRTRGLDADQMGAAIKAVIKMLNLIEKDYAPDA